MPEETVKEVIDETAGILRHELWDGAQWVADYRRLRFVAVKREPVQASTVD